MDRKWRTNLPAVHSLQPYFSFVRSVVPALPPGAPPPLASPSDLYSVYTVLHIEKKRNELRYDTEGHFYYFVASFEEEVGASAGVDAGEEESGDEEGGGEAGGEEAGDEGEEEEGGAMEEEEEKDGEGDGLVAEKGDQEGAESVAEKADGEGGEAAPEKGGGEGAGAVPAGRPGGGAAAPSALAQPASLPKGWRTRTQIVVPVSSASGRLTPRALSRMFCVRGVDAQQMLLALVDGHGVVSRTSMYNYIQAPLEGAGMADLVLRGAADGEAAAVESGAAQG